MNSNNFEVCKSKRRLSLIAAHHFNIEKMEQASRLLSSERNVELFACDSSFLQPQLVQKSRRNAHDKSLNECQISKCRSHTLIGSNCELQDTTYLFYQKINKDTAEIPFQRKRSNGIFWVEEENDPLEGKFLLNEPNRKRIF